MTSASASKSSKPGAGKSDPQDQKSAGQGSLGKRRLGQLAGKISLSEAEAFAPLDPKEQALWDGTREAT